MTAQHHDVQHETPADEHFTAPDHTDPITMPKRYRVVARVMGLIGVIGVSTMAAAIAVPNGSPWVVGG
ncbi:hypothetical protein [Kribbella pratensis]|uniref:Uncharacterized protein n=1 Tax=Kribbella pratensis TaxID=2512112 RepID=A0A4R8BYT6_9ACTN|nr:hypothetical protein [Kribbella pratensis]TDW60689.1 hypothetical protein EV653_7240 [Kribbella pratensis]